MAIAAALSLAAQTAPVVPPTVPPLLPPAGLYYRYWPLQVVQFVGAELPYSMIVLDVDDRAKEPAYDVTLTERASGRRIHYVNTPALLAEAKRKGDDAFAVPMQLDHPDAPAKGAQYLLRFNTEKGVPVQWQFVQGTDMSEQGKGLTPFEGPTPVLLYREQGALAGEGTALRVGGITSTADVWKEYAQPPYFVPYHGAVSQDVHILSLAPVSNTWTDDQPAVMADGADWKLNSAAGTTYSAHLDHASASSTVLTLSDAAKATAITIEAAATPQGWATDRVRLGPIHARPEHTVSIQFTPALTSGSEAHFDITAGRKGKLASGFVQARVGPTGATTETWTLDSPDWARGKTAAATNSTQP
ncbi:hypothetical protein D1Y84_01720 [Acidipila sp. EB88]|nr:hypothetical protein D1Y84_01720 [Acidipila sp. EB88]